MVLDAPTLTTAGAYDYLAEFKRLYLKHQNMERAFDEIVTTVAVANNPELGGLALGEALHAVGSAAQAAESLGLNELAVQQAINRGRILGRKDGGIWLIRRADLVARQGKS